MALDRVHPASRLAALLAVGGALGAWSATCTEYDASLLVYTGRQDAAIQDATAEDGPGAEADASADVVADTGTDGPVLDAEADVDAEASEDAKETGIVACDPCTDPGLLRPVCPPDMADPPAEVEPMVFAMRTVRAAMTKTASTDWQNIGLDLDCLNTQATGDPIMCKRTGSDPSVVEDGLLGRDNSFGRNLCGVIRLLELFNLITYDVEQSWNEGLALGKSGMLLELRRYSGEPNDPQVLLALYMSHGTRNAENTADLHANWDGNDLWSRSTTSLTLNDQPAFLDDAAYVTNGTIVAHLPEGVPLVLTSNQAALSMALTKSVVSLTMSPDHTKITNGVLAGAWYTTAALSALDGYAAQSGICQNRPEYAAARNVIATSSDVRADLKSAPTLDCNAMSMGLSFTAERAKLGGVVAPPPPVATPCDDAGVDAGAD